MKQARIHSCVGMNRDRALRAVRRRHQPQRAALFRIRESFLLVLRGNAGHVGLNPYLQQMRGLALGVVEFAVLHTAARAHALHIARRNALDVAHAVLVRQLATEYVADDFHVLVAVRAKTLARRNAVFIDDAQVAKAHVRRVKITGE